MAAHMKKCEKSEQLMVVYRVLRLVTSVMTAELELAATVLLLNTTQSGNGTLAHITDVADDWEREYTTKLTNSNKTLVAAKFPAIMGPVVVNV